MTDTQEVWLKSKCPTCEGAQELDEQPCDRCGGTGTIKVWMDYEEWTNEKSKLVMEPWEKQLREKLEKEVPEGAYNIGTGNFVCWTGKGGYINFRVELAKAIYERTK